MFKTFFRIILFTGAFGSGKCNKRDARKLFVSMCRN